MGTVQVLSVGDILGSLSSDRHDASELVRAPSGSLSVSASRRPAGSADDQKPQAEDEVYYVIRGRAMFESEVGRSRWPPARSYSSRPASSTDSPISLRLCRRSSSGHRLALPPDAGATASIRRSRREARPLPAS
jgi:hypothetical protein